jgi:UDP-glucose 4-epimerase
VTGSSGHLGEALVRTLRARGADVHGLDLLESPYTDHVGSVADAAFVLECARGADYVLHTATLHKPHLATHASRDFVETNIEGTRNVLEAARAGGSRAVVLTSTTSVFGSAMRPAATEPASWVTEALTPAPRNIYGATKEAAEHLCHRYFRDWSLPSVVLRTSRFFPEADDRQDIRRGYDDLNVKVNEYLYRRLSLTDAVEAHLLAAVTAPELGFARYVVSATTPFTPSDLALLRTDAPSVVRQYFPGYEEEYARRRWRMFPGIDRVYVNARARAELGWSPVFDFRYVLDRLARDEDILCPLARAVGSKGYHAEAFEDEPYPVAGGPS